MGLSSSDGEGAWPLPATLASAASNTCSARASGKQAVHRGSAQTQQRQSNSHACAVQGRQSGSWWCVVSDEVMTGPRRRARELRAQLLRLAPLPRRLQPLQRRRQQLQLQGRWVGGLRRPQGYPKPPSAEAAGWQSCPGPASRSSSASPARTCSRAHAAGRCRGARMAAGTGHAALPTAAARYLQTWACERGRQSARQVGGRGW